MRASLRDDASATSRCTAIRCPTRHASNDREPYQGFVSGCWRSSYYCALLGSGWEAVRPFSTPRRWVESRWVVEVENGPLFEVEVVIWVSVKVWASLA